MYLLKILLITKIFLYNNNIFNINTYKMYHFFLPEFYSFFFLVCVSRLKVALHREWCSFQTKCNDYMHLYNIQSSIKIQLKNDMLVNIKQVNCWSCRRFYLNPVLRSPPSLYHSECSTFGPVLYCITSFMGFLMSFRGKSESFTLGKTKKYGFCPFDETAIP